MDKLSLVTPNSPMSVLYLQDCLHEFSQVNCPEKFHCPSPSDSQSERTLIVDLGSWQCRAGWAGDKEPSRKSFEITNYFLLYPFFLTLTS